MHNAPNIATLHNVQAEIRLNSSINATWKTEPFGQNLHSVLREELPILPENSTWQEGDLNESCHAQCSRSSMQRSKQFLPGN
jgi:hypothetical protein